MNTKRIIILLIIIIFFVVLGGGAIVYAKNADTFNAVIKGLQAQREQKNAEKLFPQTLGDYELYSRGPMKVGVGIECESVENHPDTKGAGLTGEVCTRTISGDYRNLKDNSVVFIHLVSVDKGEDIFRSIFERFGSEDILSGKKIIRIESHEIAWFPNKGKFVVIMTQEGVVKSRAGGGEMMSYGRATGKNPVTEYFIETYPSQEIDE